VFWRSPLFCAQHARRRLATEVVPTAFNGAGARSLRPSDVLPLGVCSAALVLCSRWCLAAHSTKPARRSSFGSATWLSPLCSSYSAQPTRSAPLVLHCVLRSTAPLLEALEHSFRASLAFSRVWSSARATWHSVFLPLGRSTFGHFALVLARSGPQRLRSSTVRFLGYFVPAVVHCALHTNVHAIVHAIVHAVVHAALIAVVHMLSCICCHAFAVVHMLSCICCRAYAVVHMLSSMLLSTCLLAFMLTHCLYAHLYAIKLYC